MILSFIIIIQLKLSFQKYCPLKAPSPLNTIPEDSSFTITPIIKNSKKYTPIRIGKVLILKESNLHQR